MAGCPTTIEFWGELADCFCSFGFLTGMSMVLRINGLFHPYISRLDTSRN